MASVINTNNASLVAQRNLTSSQTALTTSVQRLSSGLRINSAKDDAAGLGISQKLQSQITGANVAARNANDAISMVSTAEGGMQEVSSMLQRMRELATQGNNDSLDDAQRGYITSEVNALRDEINQVAIRTTFNGKTLLNGDIGATTSTSTTQGTASYHVAAQAATSGESVIPSTTTFAASDDLKYSIDTGATVTLSLTGTTVDALVTELNANTTFNGIAVTAGNIGAVASKDGSGNLVITSKSTGATSAVAASFVDRSAFTTTPGTATAGVASVSASNGDVNFGGTANTSYAKGTVLSFQVSGGSTQTYTLAQDETGTTLAAALNSAVTDGSLTGVTASVSGSGLKLTTASATGDVTGKLDITRNSANVGTAKISANTVFAAGDDITYKVDGGASNTFSLTAATTVDAAVLELNANATFSGQATASKDDDGNLVLTSKSVGNSSSVTASFVDKSAFTTTAATSNATTSNLQFQLGTDNNSDVQDIGALFQDVRVASSGNLTDLNTAISALTTDGATSAEMGALTTEVDAAIATIASFRSDLGSMSNRLDYNIANLQNQAENLTASKSRITDTDYALETATLSKNQVMSQAATAMLSQANQMPNAVLSLLK